MLMTLDKLWKDDRSLAAVQQAGNRMKRPDRQTLRETENDEDQPLVRRYARHPGRASRGHAKSGFEHIQLDSVFSNEIAIIFDFSTHMIGVIVASFQNPEEGGRHANRQSITRH
jgi:hypothetical protein